MKIVYCTDTVCYPGGIQRVTIAKANALADIEGNKVWIAVTDNQYPEPVSPISEKVSLVDLGVRYYADDWKSRWNVLKGIFVKRTVHRRRLRDLLNCIEPDIVVSTGTSEKYFLPCLRISSSPVFIREIHFPKDYRMRAARGGFYKVLARIGNIADYRFNIQRYDRIVLLTEEDRQLHWKADDCLAIIPNPVTVIPSTHSTLQNKKVLAVGRLVHQKDFASLIRAFSLVNKRFPGWTLDIFGEGDECEHLSSLIKTLGLTETVRLMGKCPMIQDVMPGYSLFALSSRFEGFPLVLVEAQSCGLPIVSYACPCGPRDIIRDGIDGFLVPPGDEATLAERICQLIEDENLRTKMGAAALERAKEFSLEKIIPQWTSLFEELMKSKKR